MTNTCAFSGNRLIPVEDVRPLAGTLRCEVERLIEMGVTTYICGGALGFDTLCALMIIEKKQQNPNIKLISAIPFAGQEKRWEKEDRDLYHDILKFSDEVIILSQGYNKSVYHIRNRYMVDHADYLIHYDEKGDGGTAYTIAYAMQKGKICIDLHAKLGECFT